MYPDGQGIYLPSLRKKHGHVINALDGSILLNCAEFGEHNTVVVPDDARRIGGVDIGRCSRWPTFGRKPRRALVLSGIWFGIYLSAARHHSCFLCFSSFFCRQTGFTPT